MWQLLVRQFIFLRIILLFLLILGSCNIKKQHSLPEEINKITIVTGGCYGECPFLAIAIDKSLNYNYFGGEYTELNGFYTGKVSNEFWDSVSQKLERIQFKQLDSQYINSHDDMNIQVVIQYNDSIKKIRAQSADLLDSVRKILFWLLDSRTKQKLVPSKDTIRFETNA
ncbi:hypothetical protein A8C56_08695 [Niabella ginsenosidivorans]|uniref:DUF6438 domain-containing protein n=1 Tax=Niabella ginsenosidivorans TaxID=1176587 RepID=A0A1A9I098_9BACT|nr:DUF6438 domain-containing protein [Niabella ginsenosidivorans]ANH81046.1 hypothetical protein A8C56_08695 [Niabella ginsenosidivorans]